MQESTLYSHVALSGSAPLGGASPPQRRLLVETLASCGSPLSSGPPITEALAGRHGHVPSRTQRRRAQRRTQYQRLKDGPAWQTAREVRTVLTEFQKALHQVQGRSFKTMRSLPSARSIRASFTSTIDDPCTDSLHGYMQTHSDTSRTVPQCSIASDMGGTVALAVNNPIMETGICSDLGEHTDVNVDGTNDATGSARRRRYGNPSPRVPFCFSGSDHDKLVANVDSCIAEADPSVPVPLGFIGSDNGETFDVNADSPTSGDANSFAIEREAVSSLESSIHQLLCHTARSFDDACGVDLPLESAPFCAGSVLGDRHFYIGSDGEDGGDCSVTACKDAPLEPANARSLVMCSPFASCFVTKPHRWHSHRRHLGQTFAVPGALSPRSTATESDLGHEHPIEEEAIPYRCDGCRGLLYVLQRGHGVFALRRVLHRFGVVRVVSHLHFSRLREDHGSSSRLRLQ